MKVKSKCWWGILVDWSLPFGFGCFLRLITERCWWRSNKVQSVSSLGNNFKANPRLVLLWILEKEAILLGENNDKFLVPSPNQSNASHLCAWNQPLGGGFKFLKCVQPGHRLADWQNAVGHNSKELLLEEVEEIKQGIELPIYDQSLHKEVGGDFKGDEGVALMTRRTLYTKTWNTKRSCLWSAPKWIDWRRFWKWRGTYDMEYSMCTWALAALFFSMKFFSYW